jgi:hypothetical protein
MLTIIECYSLIIYSIIIIYLLTPIYLYIMSSNSQIAILPLSMIIMYVSIRVILNLIFIFTILNYLSNHIILILIEFYSLFTNLITHSSIISSLLIIIIYSSTYLNLI